MELPLAYVFSLHGAADFAKVDQAVYLAACLFVQQTSVDQPAPYGRWKSELASQIAPFHEAMALGVISSHLRAIIAAAGRLLLAAEAISSLYRHVTGKIEVFVRKSRAPTLYAILPESDVHTALLQWLVVNGGEACLQPVVSEQHGVGMVAKRRVHAGQSVVRVPLKCIMTIRRAMASEIGHVFQCVPCTAGLRFRLCARDAAIGDDVPVTPEALMALWLIAELAKREQSFFYPYLNALQSCDHFCGLGFGLDALCVLRHTPACALILREKERVSTEYESLFPLLSELYPLLFDPEIFTTENYEYAAQLILSRAMHLNAVDDYDSDGAMLCLVPVADLVNHCQHAHVQRYTHIQRDSDVGPHVRLESIADVQEGETVSMHYGPFDSAALLAFYGFVSSDNFYDAHEVVPSSADAADSRKNSLMVELALPSKLPIRLCTQTELRLNGLASWLQPSLMAALRVIVANEEEMQQLQELHSSTRQRAHFDSDLLNVAPFAQITVANERRAIEFVKQAAPRDCRALPH